MSPQQAAKLRRMLDLGEGHVDPRVVARVLERNCYLKDFFLAPLPEPGAVIDVGAQVGCFSVLALELLEPELLVAFEPDRSNLDLLIKNLAAIETSARIETALTAPWSSATRFPTASLDGQLDELGVGTTAVRILRIAAEGAENEILEGGGECLRRTSGVVGEVRHGITRIDRFRELLAGFVVAIGAPTPPAGLRPFWAIRKELIPTERQHRFVEQAELAALRESLWQLNEERAAAIQEPGSSATSLESLRAVERRLRLDREVIEWQKGSLVRLRRDHEDGLRRSAEMNAEVHRSLGSLDERLAELGRHLAAVEGSVRQASELARELAREANASSRQSAAELEERLAVLGRRLNTLQESARLEPELAQPLLASKPWRAYLWLGRTKRAVSRGLASLTERLPVQRQAALDAAPGGGRARRLRAATPHRALWIDRRLPTPDRDGASQRVAHLISVLQEARFDISFLPLDLHATEPYATALRDRGVEALTAPAVASAEAHLEERGADYDLVIVSRAQAAAECIDRVRACCPRAKVVLDTVELDFLRETRLADLEDSDTRREAAARRRQEELSAARRADLTLVVSQAEKNLLGREAPELAVHVLSTIHPRQPGAAFAARRGLLFLADFGQPHNADAALWLVEEILPAIRLRLPDVHLHLVGGNPPARLRAHSGETTFVTGFVPDLGPYLGECRVALAPLRYGAGVMAKTTQAMACGLPCVTTTLGAEGVGLVHGIDAMIADGAAEFADCVARVYADEELWLRLSQRGLERVRDEFSFAAARRSIAAMLEAVGHPWALERKFRTAEFGATD